MNDRIFADKTIFGCEPAMLEGSIPLPAEAYDASSVLEICGLAEVSEVSLGAEGVFVKGTARFSVLFSGNDGGIDSFDAECGFEHISSMACSGEGAELCASAEPVYISWRLEGSRIELTCELRIELAGFCPMEHELLLPMEDEDIEYDMAKGVLCRDRLRCVKSYAVGELRVPQTMPELNKLLMSNGYASVTGINSEDGNIVVEGELKLFIAYLSADKNAPLQFMSEILPFGEVIADPGLNESTKVLVTAVPERISVSAENDVLSVSAVLSVDALVTDEQEIGYIRDMYSLTRDTVVKRTCIPALECVPSETAKKVIRSAVSIPEQYPEASRILLASVSPEITGCVPENGRLGVDGLLHVALCYTTQDQGLKGVLLKEPFEAELPLKVEGEAVCAKAYSEYTVASGSGREIDLKTCLEFVVSSCAQRELCPVAAAEFSESGPRKSGLTLYYADGEESLFDAAKRNRTKKDSITSLDGEKGVPEKGDRLLMMR